MFSMKPLADFRDLLITFCSLASLDKLLNYYLQYRRNPSLSFFCKWLRALLSPLIQTFRFGFLTPSSLTRSSGSQPSGFPTSSSTWEILDPDEQGGEEETQTLSSSWEPPQLLLIFTWVGREKFNGLLLYLVIQT